MQDKISTIFFTLILLGFRVYSQPVNLVSNGSFEKVADCSSFWEYKAEGWSSIDSAKTCAEVCSMICGNVPNNAGGYQMPKDGQVYLRVSLFCPQCGTFNRSNIKNRLKQPLKAGKTYCCRMYINLEDNSSLACDGIGVYFGGAEVDTIKFNFGSPLTFLAPQIKSEGIPIVDTVSWLPVTGTFVAAGDEKYLVISNFKSDNNTYTVGAETPISYDFAEYYIDQVSCVEVDTEYAGRDVVISPGDSLYLGKQPEEDNHYNFIWYSINNGNVIDTATGIWVKPSATSTYVVKQELECATVWDTVVVHVNAVGISDLANWLSQIQLYPNPANDYLFIEVSPPLSTMGLSYAIYNCLGSLIRKEKWVDKSAVKVSHLDPGVYSIALKAAEGYAVTKKFLIAR